MEFKEIQQFKKQPEELEAKEKMVINSIPREASEYINKYLTREGFTHTTFFKFENKKFIL